MATARGLVAHLYRRAGFSATPRELDTLARKDWRTLVDDLVGGLSHTDPAGDAVEVPWLTPVPEAHAHASAYALREHNELIALTNWWIERMVTTDTPLREKLTLLLHEQFPTAYEKVRYVELMYRQNQIFRTIGDGAFDTLTKAVSADPAMLIWLDSDLNNKAHPNTNFARELMERFTMGIGNYSEKDVNEASRAFTGWTVDYSTGRYRLRSSDHDHGIKHFLGHRGNFSGDDIIEITTHTKASARWVVARLWSWLASPVSPSSGVVSELAPSYAKNLNLRELLGAIFNHSSFVHKSSIHTLVKQPVEFVVGTMRLLGLRTASFPHTDLQRWLSDLGQELFAPPNVGGWGANNYWVSTAASCLQAQFAYEAANRSDLSDITHLDGQPSRQVAAVKHRLAIDNFSTKTLNALLSVAREPGAETARNLVVLALVSPEYLLN